MTEPMITGLLLLPPPWEAGTVWGVRLYGGGVDGPGCWGYAAGFGVW